MSHTNSTQFYSLPQFIGTDVPGWLTDVNQGFAAIDAGMRAAQVKADNADQTAGQAANDVQAVAQTVTTQAAQISAAAGAASAAQTTANAADAKADTNANAIAGLDTRVTELEQGGGGGGNSLVMEVVSVTSGGAAQCPDKPGYVPIAAIPAAEIAATYGVFAVISTSRTGFAANSYLVRTLSYGSGGGTVVYNTPCDVTVFYAPIA